MKYSSILLITTLAVSGMAVAENSDSSNSNAATDDKVECITDFIAAELDQDQHDTYIEECVKEKQAKRQQENSKKQG